MPSGLYNAGGLSIDNDNGSEVGGMFDILGRGWNNITGTTANNIFNANEAAKGRDFEHLEAELARQHASQEAQKAREHELYMSNTAYTRAAQDMKAAGINPAMLSGLSSSGMKPASGSSGISAGSSPKASADVARASRNASQGIIGGMLRLCGTLLMMSGQPSGVGLTGAGITASTKAAKAADTLARKEKPVTNWQVAKALGELYGKDPKQIYAQQKRKQR